MHLQTHHTELWMTLNGDHQNKITPIEKQEIKGIDSKILWLFRAQFFFRNRVANPQFLQYWTHSVKTRSLFVDFPMLIKSTELWV